jgi:hypothetical protein
MNSGELTAYLANVIAVAAADRKFNPREDSAVKTVMFELGAREEHLRNAARIVKAASFEAVPVGRLSDQIRNLEDMVFVSLSDREIDPAERPIVQAFAKKLKLNQHQLAAVFNSAKGRGHELETQTQIPKIPPVRPRKAPEPIVEPPKQVVAPDTKTAPAPAAPKGITIEFAESLAASFNKAVELAASAGNYQKRTRKGTQWHIVSWRPRQVAPAVDMARTLADIGSKRVILNGEEKPWNDVFGFIECMTRRDRAFSKTEYCFGMDEFRPNIWGCKQLGMDWTEWGEWLCYGHFSAEDTFVFDKNRIRLELESKLAGTRLCPHLKLQFIKAALSLMPAEAKLAAKGPWRYKECADNAPGAVKVTIEDDLTSITGDKRQAFVSGVAPRDRKIAGQIIQQALKKLSVDAKEYKDLVSRF